MFRALLINTAFSAGVFAVSSALAVILVPILVGAYGIFEFGLIMLARTFLPTGVLAVFDLGISEVATLAVARARASNSWERASRQLTLILVAALCVGLLLVALLWSASWYVDYWLHGIGDHVSTFSAILRATALALALLMPALVFDGIVRGFEAYRALRVAELGGTLAYVGATLWVVHAGATYGVVAYVFLGSVVLRALFIAGVAWVLARNVPLRPRVWHREEREEVVARCWQMSHGKLLGAAQSQLPPLAIGAIVGPTGVGIYDVIVRIPRFAKTVLGMLNSALVPVTARLDETGQVEQRRLLGTVGVLVVPFFAIPAVASLAAFAEPLLRWWVGPEFAPLWPWQAAMYLVPAILVAVGFGSMALLPRPESTRSLLRLATGHVLLQYVIAFLLVRALQERAFVVGQVVATVVFAPWQLRIIISHQDVAASVGRQLWALIALAVACVLTTVLLPIGAIAGLPLLLTSMSAWVLGIWAMTWHLVLTRHQRETAWAALRRFAPSARLPR